MAMSIQIAPSILSADITRLGEEIRKVVDAGADWIHVDVMDGSFVPNLSFGPHIVRAVRNVTNLPVDVHLMIVNPERHLQTFANAGATHITVHYETCPHIHRTLQTIQELGVSPGIVINPGTPVSVLRELTHAFKGVLIMSVNPGFSGQAFIPSAVNKIHRMKALLNETDSDAFIQVDGGINAETIQACHAAGGTNFVAGSAIYKHPDGVKAGIEALRNAVSI